MLRATAEMYELVQLQIEDVDVGIEHLKLR